MGDDGCLAPPSTNVFAIPNEPDLLLEYELYKTSMGTKRLPSECHREVYAEEFIENDRLGTLADLCVRALAKLGTRYIAPPVKQDPLKLRIHYDSLDVNLPLEECYFVEDLRFWRRVVLAKSSDNTLQFKKIDEFDWRGMGISLKYVELVESCPAAYWPEQHMAELGQLISKYVRTLHIRHLQSLTDHSFAHYVESDPELDVTSDESEAPDISSDESETHDEEESVEEEEKEKEKRSFRKSANRKDSSVRISELPTVYEIDLKESVTDMRSEVDVRYKRREARYSRNAARQQLRDLQLEKRMEHERRKQSRALLRKLPEPAPVLRKKRTKLSSVFNMKVAPEPDDGDDNIADKRNKDKLLDRLKRYDYPAKHCHHINLSFVRYFDKLNSLTIEFLGPEMDRDYHKRHMNFSYDDMVHLATGVHSLQQLKVFRLRNSRMDYIKLLILARALKQLDALEVVDFGYDQLEDNCSVALEMLLDRKVMLKALELEYNKLERLSVDSIGFALKCHADNEPNGTPLEYLGLAHNPMGDYFLANLNQSIIGTHHVQELNVKGVAAESEIVERDISHLLRSHTPLRWLNIAAIHLNPNEGREIICSLESNHNITHFDCRDCDLCSDYEYEADIIVRRNNYQKDHKSLSGPLRTEEDIQEYLANLRNPIVKKIEAERARLANCIKDQPSESSTESSIKEEEQEEHQEQEFDIWKVLGVKTSLEQEHVEQESSFHSRQSSAQYAFVYNPNLFNLDQVREHMHLPGPGNRFYYFQKQSGALE
ncbi:uncharacterized protein LOC117779955 [Drosophila innubila]|uniref:uncharacterized protein LOC117779955 n=1 Tax=Drosophila innubila TaxID=198719 RepID=UPI00148CC2CE|nr:uncharacterized protein LOC117779955 [Drosophila innubila]